MYQHLDVSQIELMLQKNALNSLTTPIHNKSSIFPMKIYYAELIEKRESVEDIICKDIHL